MKPLIELGGSFRYVWNDPRARPIAEALISSC
jgi:hypothetical protein